MKSFMGSPSSKELGAELSLWIPFRAPVAKAKKQGAAQIGKSQSFELAPQGDTTFARQPGPSLRCFCILSGTFLSLFAQDTRNHPRLISVTGNAEIKVAPDQATLTLGVIHTTVILAVAKADKRIKKLFNLAHAAGAKLENG
jgi:Protein of unknown function (DUF541)